MLSLEQRAFFAEHGWLVLRGVVGKARVAELERALDSLVPELQYRVGYEGRVVDLPGISRGSAEIARNAHDPMLARFAAEALGTNRLRFFQDTAFLKPAKGGGRVEWHHVTIPILHFSSSRSPRDAAAGAYSLAPEATGCLRVISGGHRWGLQSRALSFRAGSVEDAFEALPAALRDAARGREAVLELQPGDLTLHHCLTFHSSGENPAAKPRKIASRCALSAIRN